MSPPLLPDEPTGDAPPDGVSDGAPDGDTGEAPERGAGRNLPAAIASGVALAGAFLGSLWIGPYAILTFVLVLVLLALWELDVAFRSRGIRPATPIAAGSGVVALFGSYATGPSAQSLALVLLVVGTLAWALLDRDMRRPGATAAALGATCLMMLWVPFLASFIGLLLARPDGVWALIAVVALSVVSDIGAYGFGTRFGRHKLAPSVSPGKSWEGFGGGILTVVVIAALIVARFPGFTLPMALLLGIAVAGASTLGDLAESLVKRDLGLKDLGRIIPGHGGIMDRADAIIFALPAGHIVLQALT